MTLIIGFSLNGCASSTTPSPDLGVYDSSVSEDQLCVLEIAGGLKVDSFDGKEVSWAQNGTDPERGNAWRAQMGGSKYKTIIRIPSGSHTLKANIYLWDYNSYPGIVPRSGYIRATGLEISYDFEPGKTYFLRPVLITRDLLFGEVEVIEYNNSGPMGRLQGVRLRIEENETTVAEGNTITR